jgi:hypothetical protein
LALRQKEGVKNSPSATTYCNTYDLKRQGNGHHLDIHDEWEKSSRSGDTFVIRCQGQQEKIGQEAQEETQGKVKKFILAYSKQQLQ